MKFYSGEDLVNIYSKSANNISKQDFTRIIKDGICPSLIYMLTTESNFLNNTNKLTFNEKPEITIAESTLIRLKMFYS